MIVIEKNQAMNNNVGDDYNTVLYFIVKKN